MTRSRVIDALGVPKETDLRTHPLCARCQVKLTRKNWAMGGSRLIPGSSELIWERRDFCEDCFLSPEALGIVARPEEA